MILDKEKMHALTEEAKTSPRLRMSYDLRTNNNDQSQRILNALEPGTVVPIHRHKNSAETVVLVEGSICEKFYSNDGKLIQSFLLSVTGDKVLQIPPMQWHSLECLESGTVIFEGKDGRYESLGEDDILTI